MGKNTYSNYVAGNHAAWLQIHVPLSKPSPDRSSGGISGRAGTAVTQFWPIGLAWVKTRVSLVILYMCTVLAGGNMWVSVY